MISVEDARKLMGDKTDPELKLIESLIIQTANERGDHCHYVLDPELAVALANRLRSVGYAVVISADFTELKIYWGR